MSKLAIVLALVALLAIPPVVVVLYVARTVRRASGIDSMLEVEVHPAEPAHGTALRFVLRAPRGQRRVRVESIVVDGALARDLRLEAPAGFFAGELETTRAEDFEPDLDEVARRHEAGEIGDEDLGAAIESERAAQLEEFRTIEQAHADDVTWLGALDVTRRGVELRIPGRSDPDARGRVQFQVCGVLGVSEIRGGTVVNWPDDLHA